MVTKDTMAGSVKYHWEVQRTKGGTFQSPLSCTGATSAVSILHLGLNSDWNESWYASCRLTIAAVLLCSQHFFQEREGWRLGYSCPNCLDLERPPEETIRYSLLLDRDTAPLSVKD